MDKDFRNGLNTEEEMEIDLYELFFLFRRRFKAILLSAVIVGLLTGLFTYFFIPPKYKATSKLYIVSASSDSVVNLSDLQIATNLTSDYKELILGRPMMESTIQNLGLVDTKYNDLVKMLDVTNPSGTRILHIVATTTDPKLSCDIANEVARLAVSWLPEVMESRIPSIAEEAVVPEKKASPSYKKNVVIGALAGAILCYGIFVIQYLLDDTVSSADEFEKYFGVVPLTSIPEDAAANDGAREGNSLNFRNILPKKSGRHSRYGSKKKGKAAKK